MEESNNLNRQNFGQQPYQFQKPKKSGCGGCLGCFVGCFFIVIILTIGIAGYGYYWANTHGRTYMADFVDKMCSEITSDPTFKDEESKATLTAKSKDFSSKIRNQEITWEGIFKGFSLLDKNGFRERIALFSFFISSLQANVGVTEEEREAMMQALKGVYDGKIESVELAVFKSMLDNASFAKINSYNENNIRTLDKNKMHQALSYLKTFVEEKKLEKITEDNFKFERYITIEAVRIMNGFIEGSDTVNKSNKAVPAIPAAPAE